MSTDNQEPRRLSEAHPGVRQAANEARAQVGTQADLDHAWARLVRLLKAIAPRER